MRKLIFILIIAFTANLSASQAAVDSPENRIYHAVRINPHPPVMDGVLDDEIWQEKDPWTGDFSKWEPYDGSGPTQKTQFKIKYDDDFLYVGFRAYDTEPDKIEEQVTRRDRFPGDWVEIQFDSYDDNRTAFSFTLSVSGVQGDELVSGDGDNSDASWNPVWEGKTARFEGGWTAEMKIPFSQLRFADKDEQTWGLQSQRRLFREDERDLWQHVAKDASGWVSKFGELRGIKGIKPRRTIEIMPYAVSKYSTSLGETGNPFNDGKAGSFLGGIDGKIGVTSNLTLDFTVNPDFGQVEADPSEVNLSAFESYFQEQRPFFVEGKNIINMQLTGGDGGFSSDNLFYSRRIGRTPHYEPDSDDGVYVDQPTETNIATAIKLTGKTNNGLSIGILNALTLDQKSRIDDNGIRSTMTAEPMTNYFTGRLMQDFREGDTRIGGMVTSTNRNIKDEHLDFLNKEAYTGGLDFVHNWNDKTYYLIFNSVFSHIKGTKKAMLDQQESSRRYFQRPDAPYVEVDPNATSMSGHGGNFGIGKGGNGHIRANFNTTWRSPGLELNDIGFLRQSDVVMQSLWMQYRIWEPGKVFRSWSMNFNQWSGWNWGRTNIFNGGNVNFNGMFKNYWRTGFGINRDFGGLDKSGTRGGPMLAYEGQWNFWGHLGSDSRKTLSYGFMMSANRKDYDISDRYSFGPNFTWRPIGSVSLHTGFNYSKYRHDAQYVSTESNGTDDRYLFGSINQRTFSMTMRLNYSLSPRLSIQYYGSPFISAGKYTKFKNAANPRSGSFTNRFHNFTGSEIAYDDDNYTVTEEDGSTYSFGNPDFNFVQLRSNLVIRWEYNPGSTLFLVWTQNRTDSREIGEFQMRSDVNDLFNVYPDNVFLIKFNRWFSN